MVVAGCGLAAGLWDMGRDTVGVVFGVLSMGGLAAGWDRGRPCGLAFIVGLARLRGLAGSGGSALRECAWIGRIARLSGSLPGEDIDVCDCGRFWGLSGCVRIMAWGRYGLCGLCELSGFMNVWDCVALI